MKPMTVIAGCLIAGLTASCSNVPYAKRTSDRLAAYTAAAGEPVKSFRFFNPLYSWEPLSDTQMVVYTRPKEAYLLDLAICPDLQFATAIGLTSQFNQVAVGFDRVLVGRHRMPCFISQIRPIDVPHLKAVQQAQRQIEQQPRDASGSQ